MDRSSQVPLLSAVALSLLSAFLPGAGVVQTVVGTGAAVFGGEGGPVVAAQLAPQR
jgi:hypothetical protein